MTVTDATALFYTALSVSLPTFGWVALGLLLYRLGWLPEPLNQRLSRLAFNFGLPVMLFAGAAQVDYNALGSARYLLAGVVSTFLTLLASWYYSRWRGHPVRLRGIFVQGAYRSNLAIIGVALAFSAYGERGPVLAALPVAILTMLYNVLAVWVLDRTLGTGAGLRVVLLGIVRNPLIIGIVAGVLLSLSGLAVPVDLGTASVALSSLFLPLMLVCIGGSLTLGSLSRPGVFAWEASVWRLCLAPLLAVLLALGMGVEGEELGVLFLLMSSPVAASSYVMVVAAKGDGVAAANLVVLTTVLSIITVTCGFFLLSLFSLVGTLQ